jgi:hypothetical protein
MLNKTFFSIFLLFIISTFLYPIQNNLILNIGTKDLSYEGEIIFNKELDNESIKNLTMNIILKADINVGNLDDKMSIKVNENKYDIYLLENIAEKKSGTHPVMGAKGVVVGMAASTWKEFKIKLKITSESNKNLIDELTNCRKIILQFNSEGKSLIFSINKRIQIRKLKKFLTKS